MSKFRTHYDNLKVARNAPDSIIRAAYKTLMQQYHPDKFEGSVDEALRIAKLIKQSYDVLIDPAKRAEHDRWIKEKEAKVKQKSEEAKFGETSQATEQQFDQKERPHDPTEAHEHSTAYENKFENLYKANFIVKIARFILYSFAIILIFYAVIINAFWEKFFSFSLSIICFLVLKYGIKYNDQNFENKTSNNYSNNRCASSKPWDVWSRFFARIFDIWLEYLIVQFLLGFALGYFWNGFIEWITIKNNEYIFNFLSFPLAFCLDAFVFHIFGNTPGKAMLGLFVQGANEQALDTEQYLKRNLDLWKSGLFFCIPILNIYAMVKQFNLVKKGLQTTYDEPPSYVVIRKNIGWIWKLCFSVSFIFILMIWATLINLEKSITNKEIAYKNNKITWDSLTPSPEKNSIEDILSKYENPNRLNKSPNKISQKTESSLNEYDEEYYKAAIELVKVYPELAEDGPASDKVLTLSGYYVNQGLKPADALRKAVRDLYQSNKK